MEHLVDSDVDEATFFPVYYHFSGYGLSIVPTLKNQSKLDWFLQQNASWNNLYRIPFAELLTTRGFGFSFNLMNSSDLYRIDQ